MRRPAASYKSLPLFKTAKPQPKTLLSNRVTSIAAGKRSNVWTPSRGSNGSYTRRADACITKFHNRALVCTQIEAATHCLARTICGG
jgi:hypothetical protein